MRFRKLIFLLPVGIWSLFRAQLLQAQFLNPSEKINQTGQRGVPAERFIFKDIPSGSEYTILLSTEARFSCFGVGWLPAGAAPADKQSLRFTYRTYNETDSPGAWKEAEADYSPDETPTRMFWTDAIFTHDAGSHKTLEIKFVLPVPMEKIIIDMFDGNAHSDTSGMIESDIYDADPGRSGECPAFPPIILRSAWCGGAAPCGSVNAPYTVTPINPTHAVMHHGATPDTYVNGQDVVRSYWNYHVNTLGWLDIGYNYLIDKYGNLYQGRQNSNLPFQDVRGAHAGSANNTSIGVNFLGNLDVSIATVPQLSRLHQLMAWWFNHKAIDPQGTAGMQTQDYGWQVQPRFTYHNAIGSTACPGNDMISRMPSIRQAIADSINLCLLAAQDTVPPVSQISVPYLWRSFDFTAEYQDQDNPGGSGIDKRFYLVGEFSGGRWQANVQSGFFLDDFDAPLGNSWTVFTGNWQVNGGSLRQTDESVNNSNVYTPLTQNSQNAYLYEWKMRIGGNGTNRRGGLHFFSDNPTLPNRGNGYLAWWRADGTNKFELYKITNDVLSIVATNTTITVPVNQWFGCKVTFSPSDGKIQVFMNDKLICSHTDLAPHTSGTHISLRNGNSSLQIDELKVLRERTDKTLISVGPENHKNVRFQSPANNQEACKIYTLSKDVAGNWSEPQEKKIFIDWQKPQTQLAVSGNWQTEDFTAHFSDTDTPEGSGPGTGFYLVSNREGSTRTANMQRGYFYDDFDVLQNVWSANGGSWSVSGGKLLQSSAGVNNSNIYAPLNQNLSQRYLYSFRMNISGTGNNRRAGLHYFCSDPQLPNRGNSYLVWFRLETGTLEFYKSVNDVLNQEKVVPLQIQAGQYHDVDIIYDRITGEHVVFLDGKHVAEWKDVNPLSSGGYISFRSGNSVLQIDSLRVYRSRGAQQNISVGSPQADIIHQNVSPQIPSASLHSRLADVALNLSQEITLPVNVDWTPPTEVPSLNDGPGADLDTFFTQSSASANWAPASDPNSGIAGYTVSLSTQPGAADVVGWMPAPQLSGHVFSSLSLNPGTVYYVNVRAQNGAGLFSQAVSSDGQLLWTGELYSEFTENGGILTVYPNPFREEFFIRYDAGLFPTGRIEISDLAGRRIHTENPPHCNQEIQTVRVMPHQGIPAGVYLLHLYTESEIKSVPLIKIN